jgi:WXG100 family type VII secretion target
MKAQQILAIKTAHDQEMSKLTQLVNGLSDTWKGQAQASFDAKYRNMEPAFRNFSHVLEEYATAITNAARIIEEADRVSMIQ